MEWQAVAGATIATVVTALAGWWVSRDKDRAAIRDVVSQASERLVNGLSADNSSLRAEVQALRAEIQALRVQQVADQAECNRQLDELRTRIAALTAHITPPKGNRL
jgi:ribosomal protein L29